MEDLPQGFLVENSSINVEFLENKTGEITTGAYLIPISETVNGIQQIGAGALLIASNYVSDLTWGNVCVYLFNSHSKVENGNLSSSGVATGLEPTTT